MSYYAEFCPYGITTLSADDSLMIFDTKEERDEFAERVNDNWGYNCKKVCRAVTVREITHRYNIKDFRNGDKAHELNQVRTCKNSFIYEIHQRPNYIL